MRAWFFRLHERVIGRDTLRCARELASTQWMSPDELRSLQQKKLLELIRHAARNTTFYRRRLLSSDWSFESEPHLSRLAELPILDKDDIRAFGRDMLWHSCPGGLFRRSTGGSSGEPLQFFIDRRRQAYDQAARMRSHEWFGVRLGAPELILWGSPIELAMTDRIKNLRDRLINQHLLSAFDMSSERMDEYVDRWNRLRPVALFGYPSSIALFIEHVRRRGVWLDARQLRAVFVTGEVCHPHQREAIQSFLQVPVANGYGSRDAGFIAHECPKGRLHITAENVIVEIVDKGLVQPVGESGEIVVTHLDAYGMPFIRYRTGDHGRLLPGRCPCGRGLPLMDVVEGRSTDFLTMPDGTTRHALSIIYPLRDIATIRRFRVTQRADLSLSVDCEQAENSAKVDARLVEQSVRRALSFTLPIEVRTVETIPSTGSGKFRYVVSEAANR